MSGGWIKFSGLGGWMDIVYLVNWAGWWDGLLQIDVRVRTHTSDAYLSWLARIHSKVRACAGGASGARKLLAYSKDTAAKGNHMG